MAALKMYVVIYMHMDDEVTEFSETGVEVFGRVQGVIDFAVKKAVELAEWCGNVGIEHRLLALSEEFKKLESPELEVLQKLGDKFLEIDNYAFEIRHEVVH